MKGTLFARPQRTISTSDWPPFLNFTNFSLEKPCWISSASLRTIEGAAKGRGSAWRRISLVTKKTHKKPMLWKRLIPVTKRRIVSHPRETWPVDKQWCGAQLAEHPQACTSYSPFPWLSSPGMATSPPGLPHVWSWWVTTPALPWEAQLQTLPPHHQPVLASFSIAGDFSDCSGFCCGGRVRREDGAAQRDGAGRSFWLQVPVPRTVIKTIGNICALDRAWEMKIKPVLTKNCILSQNSFSKALGNLVTKSSIRRIFSNSARIIVQKKKIISSRHCP